MSTHPVIWHGTQQDSTHLVSAIARNCACEFGLMGVRIATCAPHTMLIEDQRALNGLLFARRIVERLRHEEDLVGLPATQTPRDGTSHGEAQQLLADVDRVLRAKPVEETHPVHDEPSVPAA